MDTILTTVEALSRRVKALEEVAGDLSAPGKYVPISRDISALDRMRVNGASIMRGEEGAWEALGAEHPHDVVALALKNLRASGLKRYLTQVIDEIDRINRGRREYRDIVIQLMCDQWSQFATSLVPLIEAKRGRKVKDAAYAFGLAEWAYDNLPEAMKDYVLNGELPESMKGLWP